MKAARSSPSWLLTLLPLLVVCGCGADRTQGQQLAGAGVEAAETLAGYYDSLAQDTLDIWEMEAFNAALRDVEFEESQQQQVEIQLEALKRRALMARRLAAAYRALEQLASYDASAQLHEATTHLAHALGEMPALPHTPAATNLFATLAGELAGWKQSRNLRQGSELLLRTLEQVARLFASELGSYESIAEERGNKIALVADYLIEKKLVLAWPLLERVPTSLGLAWSTEKKPVEDPETIQALLALARVRLERSTRLSASAALETQQALDLLLANHRQFLAKEGVSTVALRARLDRVRQHLDEIARVRAAPH